MKNILVVNPNLINGETILSYLSSDFNISLARTVEEMKKILLEKSKFFSAIILDVNEDTLREFEALQKIHSHALYRLIPTIVTLDFDEKKIQKSMSFGALGYITYPISKDLLLSTLNNLIQMRENASLTNTFRIDELTNLPRKTAFFNDAENMINKQEPGYYVLSCIDIENFKVINDQYGFDIGDNLLKHVGNELKAGTEKLGGLCFRHSADKFGIMYPASFKESEIVKSIYEKIVNDNPTGRPIKIRIGRYIIDDFSISVSAMFDRAALAEETIKGRYDLYVVEYSNVMRNALINEQKIINEMNDALLNNEFEPWFQPQYNHVTGALIGAEALVRWKKNDSYIFPSDFIPVFERNGFIYQMDQYMWESVCKLLRKWLDEGLNPLPVSVNVSRRDLFHRHFIEVLCGIVNKYNVPYNLLRLEVTESAFAEASGEIIKKVGELIKLGFTVEIDDFGSGYSSLNTLKDVPASILKLDMRFFEKKGDQQRGGNIIESVVRMAKWLGMSVIAEGVEKKQQADFLKSIGCYYIQGYFYSKPIPLSDFEKILYTHKKEPDLKRVKTIKHLNNNNFWDPTSMETLIFNSYIGGACIFEYYNGKTELLRINEQYTQELNGLVEEESTILEASAVKYLDEENLKKLYDNIEKAIATEKESTTEVKVCNSKCNPPHIEYVRTTARVIASVEDRYLLYCVIVNTTETHLLEQKRFEAEKKQLQSAKQLEIIMDNIDGGVSAIQIYDDFTSKFIFNNEKYFELYGYTQEEVKEKNIDIMNLIDHDDRENILRKIKEIKADKKSLVIDYCCTKKNGKKAYLRAISSIAYMEEYGDVVTSVVTDITEQKETNDKFKAIINNIDSGISATYYDGKRVNFAIINKKYYDVIGYTKEQFEKEVYNIFDIIHPEDRERVYNIFMDENKKNEAYSMEYRIICRDGNIKNIQCNTNVVNLFGFSEPLQLAVSNDITELRMAQKNERDTIERLKKVFDTISIGVSTIVLKPDGTIQFLFVNEKYYEIIGYCKKTYEKIIEKGPFLIIHPDDHELVRNKMAELKNKEGSVALKYRILKENVEYQKIRAFISITTLPGIDYPVQISSFELDE